MGYNKERYRTLKGIAYYMALGVWYAFSLLPFWVLYILSDMIYGLLYYVVGYRKKVVRENLASSFPEKSEEELRRIERGFYHFLCDYLIESVKMMTMSKKNMRKRMVFKGTDLLQEYLEKGQTCALYFGHYCNWEWVATLPLWVKTEPVQIATIYHPLENLVADRLFLRLRSRIGCLCISMQDTLRVILDYHKRGIPMCIGYISDQKPYWTNIHHWVNFLNHDTPVLTGTERVVRKMNQAAFYLDLHRVRRGYYEGEFKLMSDEPKKLKEFELTDIYNSMLEESIRRAPEFWLWSHKRWSRTHEEFDRNWEVVDGKVMPKKTVESSL